MKYFFKFTLFSVCLTSFLRADADLSSTNRPLLVKPRVEKPQHGVVQQQQPVKPTKATTFNAEKTAEHQAATVVQKEPITSRSWSSAKQSFQRIADQERLQNPRTNQSSN